MKNQTLIPVTLITLFLIYLSSAANCQQITYTHNASGNRITREFQVKSMNSVDSTEQAMEGQLTETIDAMEINLYPNPTQGMLQIDILNLPENPSGEISICDLEGRRLMQFSSISSSSVLDLTSLPSGNYILNIIIGSKMVNWQIIKE